MGQRTQLLVIEKMPNNVTEKRVYHNQWGHGKRMFNGMMSIVSSLLDGCSYDGVCEPLLKNVELKNLNSFSDYFRGENPLKWYTAEEWDGINIDDLNSIRNLYDGFDNNDGGLVVEVEWVKGKEDRYESRIRAGFLLHFSEKDDGKFSKWVSPERYAEQEGGKYYFDDNFINAFQSLCKFADVKWMHEKEE